MAEEYGLQLDLNLNFSEYEAELARVDSETQKVMKKLRSDLKGDALKFDIQISGAQAAGDTVKAYQLQLQKLTHTYKAQEAVVSGLKKRLDELNASQVKDAKAVAQVSALLDKETLKLNKLKISLNSFDASFADKIIGGLSRISPGFANAIQSVKMFRAELAGLSSMTGAGAAFGALAGAGIGVGVLAGGYEAIKKAHEAMDGLSTASAEATEPIFQLREAFDMTYEDAEKLHGIFAIDGTNAEAFAKSLQKLNKAMLSGNAGVAGEMLARYNVELRNADGTQKSYIEQTKALADAYKEAAKNGEQLDLVTATLGSGGSQFTHLLNGFDDYLAGYKEINAELKINYALNHALLDEKKKLAEAERQFTAISGQAYTPAVIAGMKESERLLKERSQRMAENVEAMNEYKQALASVEIVFARVTQGWAYIFDNAKNYIARGAAGIFQALDGSISADASKGVADAENEAKQKQAKQNTLAQEKANAELAKKEEESAKKIAAAYAKVSRELADIGATDYEKQLNRLKDEVDANIKAGVDELTAWDVYYRKKDELDRKTSEEAKKRLEDEVKKQEQVYQQELQRRKQAEQAISQVFMTETEKRIAAIKRQRDEWIKAGADEVRATQAAQAEIKKAKESEAERALRENLDLARFITNEQKKGNENWKQAAQEFAQRQYLQGFGATVQDVQNIAKIGPDMLRNITDTARERVLAPITANITVNFDNAIMEDVATQDKMANNVANIILDGLREVMGNANYSYGGAR